MSQSEESTSARRGWSAVRRKVWQLGEPLCLHLISSRLGCDARSGLRLRACLRAQLQPLLVVLEACFTPEPLGPDGHSAAGLRKSRPFAAGARLPVFCRLHCARSKPRAEPGCFRGATGLEDAAGGGSVKRGA